MSYNYNPETAVVYAECDRCGFITDHFSPQGRLPEGFYGAELEINRTLSDVQTFNYCFCSNCIDLIDPVNAFKAEVVNE